MGADYRPVVLLYLPAHNALPGFDAADATALNAEIPEVEWRPCPDREAFLRDLPEARGAVVWEFRPKWLENAPMLRLISTPAAGKDWVRVEPRPGLAVEFGTFHGELIGETVLGLVLAFARGIRHSMERQRSEPWARGEIAGGMRAVRGSHAVIVGFGHIGKWIGHYLKPLGVRLTGVNRRDISRPDYFDREDRVIGLADLDAVLPEADHLILALPGGEGTDGVIDSRRLALLPRHAVLYNIGRGNAVDMPALVRALGSGALAGAGLDVFDREPLPADAPIRDCPNVILMPHVSAFGPNYMSLYMRELLSLVRMHMLGNATE